MSEKIKKNTKTKESKPKSTKKAKSKKIPSKTKELNELKEKLDEANDKYLRLQAEFDNYRKRTLQEKMQLIENGGKDILKEYEDKYELYDEFDYKWYIADFKDLNKGVIWSNNKPKNFYIYRKIDLL